MFCRLPAFHPVLSRELERRFGGLGSTPKDVGAVHAARPGHEFCRELLDGFVGERGATDVRDATGLARHRLANFAHAMSDTGDERTADAVEVSLPRLVFDPAPLATHGQWVVARKVPIEDRRIGVAVHER